MRIGIIGGAGYTAGELLRILTRHPYAEISFVYSTSQPGVPVTDVHTDLAGETDLRFTDRLCDTDVLFLCLGHGVSREFLTKHEIGAGTKIIDLGNDFRTSRDFGNRTFVYGLPEINREKIKISENIANPGCFATAIQLALLPLAHHKLLNNEIHVNGVTGSTGAGRSLSETSHFSYREGNMAVYKAFEHQHLKEILATLQQIQGNLPELNFIPVRGNFTRGIFASLYTVCDLAEGEARALYNDFYADHPFTHVINRDISLKDTVNTNKCLLNLSKYGNKLLITCAIDNLLKGASGQAVQNMNLMFGLNETCGLQLKPAGF